MGIRLHLDPKHWFPLHDVSPLLAESPLHEVSALLAASPLPDASPLNVSFLHVVSPLPALSAVQTAHARLLFPF